MVYKLKFIIDTNINIFFCIYEMKFIRYLISNIFIINFNYIIFLIGVMKMVKNVVLEINVTIGIFVINMMKQEKNGKHLKLNGITNIKIILNVLLLLLVQMKHNLISVGNHQLVVNLLFVSLLIKI